MDCIWYIMDCIHARLVYVRLGLVPGRHPSTLLYNVISNSGVKNNFNFNNNFRISILF